MVLEKHRMIKWLCRWRRRWRVFGSVWRTPAILRLFLVHKRIVFLLLILTMSTNDDHVNS